MQTRAEGVRAPAPSAPTPFSVGRTPHAFFPATTITPLQHFIAALIRERGPITAAEYIELALYHPERGYYAAAPRRSGRKGDFYTSVDASPLFGATVAVQLDEMWSVLREGGAQRMDLVEAGAGDGRLTRDILDAAAHHYPDLYAHVRATAVERSAAARARHPHVLAAHADRCVRSEEELPQPITGVILANELLDAMPVHLVVGTSAGPRELYVGERDGMLVEMEGPLSSRAVAEYIGRERVRLRPGARAEIGLRAVEWIARAAAALHSGFLLLFDYGLSAAELYSDARPAGTLTTFRRHAVGAGSWLRDPGEADITSHVNFTAIARAAESAGLVSMGATDQTYFLLHLGMLERLPDGEDARSVSARLAAKTLLMPGGLGSTMKVLAFGKQVPGRALRGFSSARLT